MEDLHTLADEKGLRRESIEGQRVVAGEGPNARRVFAIAEQAAQCQGRWLAATRLDAPRNPVSRVSRPLSRSSRTKRSKGVSPRRTAPRRFGGFDPPEPEPFAMLESAFATLPSE